MVLRNHVTKQKCSMSTDTLRMVTRLGRLVTYHESLPLIKSHDYLITWTCKITQQNDTILYPLSHSLCSLNLAGSWLIFRGSYQYSHISFNHVILWDHREIWKHFISFTTIPMITKLGRVVTYHEELLLKKLQDSLVTLCLEVALQN